MSQRFFIIITIIIIQIMYTHGEYRFESVKAFFWGKHLFKILFQSLNTYWSKI